MYVQALVATPGPIEITASVTLTGAEGPATMTDIVQVQPVDGVAVDIVLDGMAEGIEETEGALVPVDDTIPLHLSVTGGSNYSSSSSRTALLTVNEEAASQIRVWDQSRSRVLLGRN